MLCKPCWELKYCPYGIMVETMPLLATRSGEGEDADAAADSETPEQLYARAIEELRNTDFENDNAIWQNMFFVLFADPGKHEAVKGYDARDVSCMIFGHVCPVFFYGRQGCTETKDLRRRGRHIPRDIMLKVVRRDNYRCQMCGKTVDDRDIELDHIIPHSKGGPTNVENLRLLCGDCNRRKSNSLSELLDDFKTPQDE